MNDDTQRLVDGIKRVEQAFHNAYEAGTSSFINEQLNAVDRLTFHVRGLLEQINSEWGTSELRDDDSELVEFRRMIEAVRMAALSDARDAVAAADPYWTVDDGEGSNVLVMSVADALAAIDALD